MAKGTKGKSTPPKKRGRPRKQPEVKYMEITIPESLDDIKLSDWQKFYNATQDKDVSQDFINRIALQIFFGIKGKDYERVKAKDVEVMVSTLNKALAVPPKLQMTFTMNGVKYGFVPNLQDITFGELINLDENAGMDKLHKQMSILYRPIIKEKGEMYRIAKYKSVDDFLMKDMPVGVALSAVNFIWTLGTQLASSTLKSSENLVKQLIKKGNLPKSGSGLEQSIPQPKI